jgi:predicted DNA-binding protein
MALKALEEYLEDQHDYHVAVDAYNEYIQNGRKGTSLEDVKKELGL